MACMRLLWHPHDAGRVTRKMLGLGQRRSNIPSALVRGGVKGEIGVAGMDTLRLSVVVGLEVPDIARDAAMAGGNICCSK